MIANRLLTRRSLLGAVAATSAGSFLHDESFHLAPISNDTRVRTLTHLEHPSTSSQLNDVNTTDIADAIALGCKTMSRVFNADDDDIPFFAAVVLPEPGLGFNASHSESHVPGRHLNALLTASDLLGITVPDDVIDRHAAAAFYSFSGPLPLPLNRELPGSPLRRFLPHNLREGFHALYALSRFRSSAEANQRMHASIQAVNELWDPVRGWDRTVIEGDHGLLLIEWDGAFITGIARAIGPLVKYFQATSYEPALDLAIRLKDKAIGEVFLADGTFDTRRFGTHTHSTTSVMSSLAQLADATDDVGLLRRVLAFYDNGLKEISDAIGWSIENAGPDSSPDRGESNNTGDIIETALILGRRVDPTYFNDAELFLRSHLLPSQLRDVSFIPTVITDSQSDGRRDVAKRLEGAFGFPAPYGHKPFDVEEVQFNLDIVGGAVGSLCEAYRASAAVESDASQHVHVVNMLFDVDTDDISVVSPYVSEHLTITLKTPGNLRVRLPRWTGPASVQVSESDLAPGQVSGSFLEMSNPPVDRPIHIDLPLVSRETTLKHRTRAIEIRFLGDQVLAMDSFGADLVFFDRL